MNTLEYIALAAGIMYVVLAARSVVWCWPAGILSSIIYVYLNFEWSLYYDSVLQVFYVFAGFYGWCKWQISNNIGERKITALGWPKTFVLLPIGITVAALLGAVSFHYTNSIFSYADAGIAVFSLMATYLTAKRIIDNWIWWIAIDLICVVLYYMKSAEPTSLLFAIYTIVAVYGYFEWKKTMRLQ